jgi:RNA polymerase sigma-70 factor (ECF subfamily)
MKHSHREVEEQILVQLAQSGDKDAFATLIDRYDRRLLYYVRRLLGEAEMALDVMQLTWLQVYRRLASLRSPQAFRVWLFRIAHDQAVSELRRQGLRPVRLDREGEEFTDACQEACSETLENAELIHRALAIISLEHRQVLTLRFLEGMTVDEIAEVTRIPAGTVKSRLHYARLAIRSRIEELSNDLRQ